MNVIILSLLCRNLLKAMIMYISHFLDILNMYMKEHRGINEVYQEVNFSNLKVIMCSTSYFDSHHWFDLHFLVPVCDMCRLPHSLMIIQIFLMSSQDFGQKLQLLKLHTKRLYKILINAMTNEARIYPTQTRTDG